MTVRIGTSGWTYPEWRGHYYPDGLPQRRQLEYLADRLSTVEINGSFYSLRRPSSYRSWYDRTPGSFLFAVKGHRFVTHHQRLRDAAVPLANFLASGVLELGDKLGPLLWQFPPTLRFDPALVADFLAVLPSDTTAAADLARLHATMVPTEGISGVGHRPLRHAVEVRHPSFRSERFYDLLRERGVALVTADTAGRWPCLAERTAGFAYVRLHGDTELYVSAYDAPTLAGWAAQVREWASTGDVYVYFDNTARSAAPYDAEQLCHYLRAAA
jgi:uncharacterized protein YecE (DUF72 family)